MSGPTRVLSKLVAEATLPVAGAGAGAGGAAGPPPTGGDFPDFVQKTCVAGRENA